MAKQQTDSWVKRAQRVLGESRRGTGAARRALLELLDAQPCALTALEIEDVLREGERPVARASIYRILDELERLNLVHKIQVGQAMARYEPVRLGEGHHHHLVCDSCGTVIPFSDRELESAIRKLSRRVPIQVAEHEIVLHGACQSCAQ
jgi:Fur family ferric uptake transcriptional regulator